MSLSKQAGDAWRLLPASKKKKWAKKAHDASVEHARKHPSWTYKPGLKYQQQQPRKNEEAPAPHVNPVSPTLLQDNTLSHDLMRRKESLRLHNWDDSVLLSTPQPVSYPTEPQLYQLPASLRRRSSSVPIPETWNLNSGTSSSFPNQTHFLPSRPPSPSSMGHRLSYSGFRPGFMPLDIFEQQPPHHPQRRIFEDPDLQPLPVRRDDPPPSFEGYRIVYLPVRIAILSCLSNLRLMRILLSPPMTHFEQWILQPCRLGRKTPLGPTFGPLLQYHLTRALCLRRILKAEKEICTGITFLPLCIRSKTSRHRRSPLTHVPRRTRIRRLP
jgi:hypothetical protein